MKYGYIRVSTDDQNTARQEDALSGRVDKLIIEKKSAGKKRPAFDKMIKNLKAGDSVVILSLDRAFRSTVEAIMCSDAIREAGAHFHILDLNQDTSTPNGRMMFQIIASFAEFERAMINKRTKEGLDAARKRGVKLGRPPALTKQQIDKAIAEIERGAETVTSMSKLYNVARSTLHRALNAEGQKMAAVTFRDRNRME